MPHFIQTSSTNYIALTSVAVANVPSSPVSVGLWLAQVGSAAAWNSTAAYVPGNLVTNGGNTYICVAAVYANSGILLSNLTYWLQVTLSNQHAWTITGTYTVGQYVQMPSGYQQLTSFNGAAVALNVPYGARAVWLQAEADNVRMRFDGVAPTSTVGVLLVAGANIIYVSEGLTQLQVIGVSGSSILNVQFTY